MATAQIDSALFREASRTQSHARSPAAAPVTAPVTAGPLAPSRELRRSAVRRLARAGKGKIAKCFRPARIAASLRNISSDS
jgi:hypothetical protein